MITIEQLKEIQKNVFFEKGACSFLLAIKIRNLTGYF